MTKATNVASIRKIAALPLWKGLGYLIYQEFPLLLDN